MNKKKRLIISILSVIILISLIFIPIIISNQHPDFPDINDGAGDEIDEKSLIFYNRDILELATSVDISAIILDNITTVVFSDEEMKYSKDNKPLEDNSSIYFDATIDAGDFSSYDPLTNRFSLTISDGRIYNVITRTDTTNSNFSFVYTAILRDGSNSGIYVLINGSNSRQKDFETFAKNEFNSSIKEVKTYELVENSYELID